MSSKKIPGGSSEDALSTFSNSFRGHRCANVSKEYCVIPVAGHLKMSVLTFANWKLWWKHSKHPKFMRKVLPGHFSNLQQRFQYQLPRNGFLNSCTEVMQLCKVVLILLASKCNWLCKSQVDLRTPMVGFGDKIPARRVWSSTVAVWMPCHYHAIFDERSFVFAKIFPPPADICIIFSLPSTFYACGYSGRNARML